MKQYSKFGEYMFDLLFAPLKRGKRAVNQFFIFFNVIGRVFDGLKKDALRVRDETNIATASPIMLSVHGQDRDMPRLVGEDIEAYRTRLAMKSIISEWSGTRQGILYILTALGYEQARITSVGPQDPTHWAEFVVDLGVGNEKAVRDIDYIYSEIQTVKEASSKIARFIVTHEPITCSFNLGGIMTSVVSLPLLEQGDRFDFLDSCCIGGKLTTSSVMPIGEMKEGSL